jgi:uncharacterized protein HemY
MQPAVWDNLDNQQRVDRFNALLARFEACERQCPTYGLSYAMAGQLRLMGLGDARGAREIETAYRLAPTHPAVCFIAGRQKAAQGDWEGAQQAFAAAIARRYSRNDILAVYLKELHRPDRAGDLFAEDWEMLRAIAQFMEGGESSGASAEAMRCRAENVLRREAQRPDAPVQALVAMADLLHKDGALADAVAYYRRAIDADYAASECHLALSRLLAEMGEDTQSRQEAAIASRLRQK